MGKIAFELRDGVEDFAGGTTSLPGGKTFDVGKALEEGAGKIEVDPTPAKITRRKDETDDALAARQAKEERRAFDDMQVVEALNRYPALKTTQAGDDSKGGS
jgi:hypothetical protein